MSFSSSSEKSVKPSPGLSAGKTSGRCEDAIFAAMMSLISKNFQENVRESHQLSAYFNLSGVLVKRLLVYMWSTRTSVRVLDHVIGNGHHVQWGV
jgi:hypothetical protein